MSKIKSKAVRVKVKNTEKVRKELIKNNFINKNLKIFKKNGFAYIPIKKSIKKNSDIVTVYFKKIKENVSSYKEKIDLKDNIKDKLPTSFDIIGDIAIIKLDSNIKEYREKIGKAILSTYKNINTVCLNNSISGEYRTRDIEIIAGKNQTSTIHKEYNLSFLVDVKKVYFSPRLANERKRIADMVKNNEVIVDMFTGVAPFPIMICKYSNPKIIYALDKNEDAIKLAKKNVRKNKFYDKIKIICGDSKNVKKLLNKNSKFNIFADRIIMNIPFTSFSFFNYTLALIKNKSVIHYYEIISEEKIDERINDLKKIASKKHISLENFQINKIKSYSPREFYIGIDITAKKNADVA